MCVRSAAIGDVVEVSYQVRLPGQAQGQGQIVDGAASLAVEGARLFWKGTFDRVSSSSVLCTVYCIVLYPIASCHIALSLSSFVDHPRLYSCKVSTPPLSRSLHLTQAPGLLTRTCTSSSPPTTLAPVLLRGQDSEVQPSPLDGTPLSGACVWGRGASSLSLLA
jgi:hypothetical protein